MNAAQLDAIAEQYSEIIADGMDWKTMYQYVYDNLCDYHQGLGYHDLKEHIETYDEDLWKELCDNNKDVTSWTPDDKGVTTYSLKPGETLSFPVHKSAAQDSWDTGTHFSLLGRFGVYNEGMNKSHLQEVFPSLLQKGYTVREINESCQSHKNREVPDQFKNRYSTYEDYLEAISDFMNGLWIMKSRTST